MKLLWLKEMVLAKRYNNLSKWLACAVTELIGPSEVRATAELGGHYFIPNFLEYNLTEPEYNLPEPEYNLPEQVPLISVLLLLLTWPSTV